MTVTSMIELVTLIIVLTSTIYKLILAILSVTFKFNQLLIHNKFFFFQFSLKPSHAALAINYNDQRHLSCHGYICSLSKTNSRNTFTLDNGKGRN